MTFKQISKEQFFSTVGQLDVHPRVLVESFKTPTHVSVWELKNRAVVGRSESTNGHHRYFVPA